MMVGLTMNAPAEDPIRDRGLSMQAINAQ